ncbi:MAG: LysE family translocator [Alloprevotella sp.]
MNHIAQFWLEYSSPFLLLVKGLLIGVIASAPMGPVGVLCIQRTMLKGRSYGLATGAGAALSDIIYALITGLGMSFVMDFVEQGQTLFILKLLGSAMLFVFGIYMLRIDPRKCIRRPSGNKGTLVHNFVTAFFVTFSNPLIIFLFIALFNMFTFVIPDNLFGQCVGYISIVAGAMLWWAGLTYVLTRMTRNFGLRGIFRLNHTIGVVVVAVSVIYALMTLLHLSLY